MSVVGVATMESRLDTLNLKQKHRTSRLLCKACKQNNLCDCWHIDRFICSHEGHTAEFCSEKKGN